MNKKIKVMQFTANLGIGGLERVVVNLAKNLNKDKFHVSVCCLKFKGAFAEELEDDGIKIIQVPQKKDGTDYFAFWKIKDIIRYEKPSIVHTHNANAGVEGTIASLLSGVPVNIHTDHARSFPDTLRTMLAERILSHFINRIVAVSAETKQNLIKYEHIQASKINIINNGIDGKKYDISIDILEKKKELGLERFHHIVGLGVRLTRQKGLIHFVNAAPAVLRSFPDTAFVVAGTGYLLDDLINETKKLKIENNFFFLGPRLDMPDILQILDVYVLPSEWEGLPLVLLEAMAARRAIVATDVGGNSMAIEDENCGYLIPPQRPDLLAEKINAMLESDEARRIFADNAYRKFQSQFDIKHMVSEYEKIYEEELLKKGIVF